MKFQFSTRTLLLGVAAASVLMGMPFLEASVFRVIHQTPYSNFHYPRHLVTISIVMTPLWMPLVFLGYAVGRRSLTAWTVIALVAAEAIAICALLVLYPIVVYPLVGEHGRSRAVLEIRRIPNSS